MGTVLSMAGLSRSTEALEHDQGWNRHHDFFEQAQGLAAQRWPPRPLQSSSESPRRQ